MVGDTIYLFPTSSGNRWESVSKYAEHLVSYHEPFYIWLFLSTVNHTQLLLGSCYTYPSETDSPSHQGGRRLTYLGLCNDSKSREGYLTQFCDVSFDVLMYTWQGLLGRCRLLYHIRFWNSWFFYTRIANHQTVTHDFVPTARYLNLTHVVQWSKTKSTLL